MELKKMAWACSGLGKFGSNKHITIFTTQSFIIAIIVCGFKPVAPCFMFAWVVTFWAIISSDNKDSIFIEPLFFQISYKSANMKVHGIEHACKNSHAFD